VPHHRSTFYRYSYGWLVLVLFATSFAGHFILSMAKGDSLIEWGASVLENIQSEMFQLALQVGGLAFFLFVGSPASKEGSERVEAKLDALLRQTPDGRATIETLDRRFMRDDRPE